LRSSAARQRANMRAPTEPATSSAETWAPKHSRAWTWTCQPLSPSVTSTTRAQPSRPPNSSWSSFHAPPDVTRAQASDTTSQQPFRCRRVCSSIASASASRSSKCQWLELPPRSVTGSPRGAAAGIAPPSSTRAGLRASGASSGSAGTLIRRSRSTARITRDSSSARLVAIFAAHCGHDHTDPQDASPEEPAERVPSVPVVSASETPPSGSSGVPQFRTRRSCVMLRSCARRAHRPARRCWAFATRSPGVSRSLAPRRCLVL
jgi:hypothetical protein